MSPERLWLKAFRHCADDFRNFGLPGMIAAYIVLYETECCAEHWDVIEDEVTKQESKSGTPIVWR